MFGRFKNKNVQSWSNSHPILKSKSYGCAKNGAAGTPTFSNHARLENIVEQGYGKGARAAHAIWHAYVISPFQKT